MKLFELAKLDFNTQAQLARNVSDAFTAKFGFPARIQLYDHAGDEKHKGSGNMQVTLKKKKDIAEAEFLGDVILPWLRDNLEKLMQRPVSHVSRTKTYVEEKHTELGFNFHFAL